MNIHRPSINNTLYLNMQMLICDYFAVLAAEETAYVVRNLIFKRGYLHIPWLNFWFAFPCLYLFFMGIQELYRRRMPFYEEVRRIFYASLYGTSGTIFILYVGKTAVSTSRFFVCFFGMLSFVALTGMRYAVKKYFACHNMFLTPVLLIGEGVSAELLARNFTEDVGLGYRIVGVLSDGRPRSRALRDYPYLGTLDLAEQVIAETGVSHVYIALPQANADVQQRLINRIQPLVRNISIVPDLIDIPAANIVLESVVEQRVLVLGLRNNLRRPVNRFIKSLFDYTLTIVGTICISPILLLIALWIYLDSPGPIIFKQTRIGKNGRKFHCYKFRTMCADAQEQLRHILETDTAARIEWERDYKLKDDPRVTRSGRFLRRTSLDELPQIVNVLRGEMSLVGPRPIVAEEAHYYNGNINDYYLVKPGITGMWQVSGRSDTGYDERVRIDTWYVRNWSVWLDMTLLFRTIKTVLSQKGAY